MAHLPICPRCGHYIPSDAEPGSAAGPMSLAGSPDSPDALEVCSPCAWHETWLASTGQDTSVQSWPVAVPDRFYGVIGSC